MNKKIKISRSFVQWWPGVLLFLLTVSSVAGSRWLRLNDTRAISSAETVPVYLDSKTELTDLAAILVDSTGVVNNKAELFWAANMLGWNVFQKGHYLVDRGYTYEEFLSKLAKGIQDPVSLTILPGRSESRIISTVAEKLQFDSLSFHKMITDSAFLAVQNLQPQDVIGRLYPNTYALYWTASPQAVIKRILDEFNRMVNNHKSQFDKVDKSVNEIITLASIIEWEASNDKEKRRISGLYWNRLDKGIPLQSDPTVNFALGERRRLLYEDYKIDHPYNTYLYQGLPPGPITNPGLGSIEAALNPEEHAFLYMVANPEGNHSFSKTFKEHKQKSAEWRKWIQEQYRIKRQRENQ